jgi:hypothetical protein
VRYAIFLIIVGISLALGVVWAVRIKDNTPWYWRIFIALCISWVTFGILGGTWAGLFSVWENLDYWLCGFLGFGVGWFACWGLYTNCGANLKKEER